MPVNSDLQTVHPNGSRSTPPRIDGVKIIELGNIITRSGMMTEIFRTDWEEIGITVKQVNWAILNPGAITDWHMHRLQTDYIVAVTGIIKLALWDGRETSPTSGAHDIIRFGVVRPVLVIVPSGVWHGLHNESGAPAGYINLIDKAYVHENPDNYRLSPGAESLPNIL